MSQPAVIIELPSKEKSTPVAIFDSGLRFRGLRVFVQSTGQVYSDLEIKEQMGHRFNEYLRDMGMWPK